ncbi:E3 ubiquitin-protein ligase TRIM71-like [Mytilus trossulus]|uniref:E3 ubiquitin-protein ligase TRIM71-like n=1 Tax=Mytilus trossulus TaxID=6551 RepID=UPI003005877E
MASSFKQFCTICNDDGISNRAVTWCTECEVLFCGDCEKHHNKSRLSKNHKIMSAKDYQKLPALMQEISCQCRDHNKKFELYCSVHACACCVQCITDKHQKCQDMKPLSDVLNQVKLSASVQLFEKDLNDVRKNYDKAIKYMKARINIINIQKTEAVGEIRSMRKSIADYLNKLEQTVLDDLESKHSDLKLNMTTLVDQMEQQASKIERLQSQFTKIMQYASELQIYIGLREVEKITSQAAKYIEALDSGDHFSENNIEINISSALQSILQDVKSFGDININTFASTLKIKAGRKNQAQHLVPKFTGIEYIKPSLVKRLTVPQNMRCLDIKACLALPDGKFAILDSCVSKAQVLLFSNEGIFIRQIVTLPSIGDACFVKNNTVAVTLAGAGQIALVDVEKNAIIEQIKLIHNCNGAASDFLAVSSTCGSQITAINLNDMSQSILEVVGAYYISLFQENIYCSIFYENKVWCYNSTGELLWTFAHQDIDKPTGMTLDKNGFVYIVPSNDNSIVVVSPDGKTCKTILTETDLLNFPYAIDIHRETGTMIVSSYISDDSDDGGRLYRYHSALVYKI